MTRVPVHFTFQPSACLDCRVGVRLEISNQTPYHIAQLRSISKISQLTSMARPKHIPSYHPSKFSSCAPSQTPFSNSIPSIPLPHTHPTTHSKTHHHSFHSPHPNSISHMGYTRPLWAATRVTLHSHSRMNPTPGSSPGSSPGCSRVSSRAQGLVR